MSSKIIIAIVVVLLVLGSLTFIMRKAGNKTESNPAPVSITPPAETPPSTLSTNCTRMFDETKLKDAVEIKNKSVTLQIKGFGDVTIALADKDAPKTTENFLKLVHAGFYDCLTFHRITDIGAPSMPGRIVQGGDPEGTGMGGPGYTVPAEIKLKHTKGAIAMARTGDGVNPKRDSSGSQFYIAVDPLPFLDGQYTVFGQVTSGMDVVEKISAVKTDAAGKPDEPVVIEKAIIK